jgi:WS/DGAT/MGAT family acyltransferase
MHVTGVTIYRAGPLRNAAGGIDIAAFKRRVAVLLPRLPRYRQKLRWVPFERQPVWVDDAHFNLDYHVRHTGVPHPGSLEELKRKAARIMVQPLDRSKPLWEAWIVEGLEGDRFALIHKIHHALAGGGADGDLVQLLLASGPVDASQEPRPFIARPEPSAWELFRSEWSRHLSLPAQLRDSVRWLRDQPEGLRWELSERLRGVGELLGVGSRPALDTPLNGEVGPHRRFDWLETDLEQVKAVRRALGCSVNDVILATVAGAVRAYFLYRHTSPEGVDFRVSAPVSQHGDGDEEGPTGGRISPWVLPLPIGEADPLQRVDAIHEATTKLRQSRQPLGAEVLSAAAEWTPSVLMSLAGRALAPPLSVNLVVTNVPGPQHALYLLGCEMLSGYGAVPLLDHTGLSIAVTSYNGRLCWGFNADRALLPDLRRFVEGTAAAFDELARAAGVDLKERPPATAH